jgi:hypothetical protein
MSITQEEIASGRKSGSNGATRGNSLGSGFGSEDLCVVVIFDPEA